MRGRIGYIKAVDEAHMGRALRLALKGRGMTSPNPMVGAVVVQGGRVIIAEGYHERAGAPHAEAVAIQKAGARAKGATLYVTLEPCCHTNKRTPPCTKAIIGAGLKRVVMAMPDPNPLVAGRGARELERAGLDVVSGVLEDKARRLNEAYIKHVVTKTPFVILKSAMSLDGKIATRTGESKWITGERARGLVHRLRADVDAILTAVGTVKADNPELTARLKGAKTKNPIRIVIDPGLESPPRSKIFSTPPGTIPSTIIITREKLPSALSEKGVKAINFKGRLSLKWLMRKLGAMNIMSVLIEGGSSLNAYALSEGVVDKVMFFLAPKIIGGRDAFPAVGGQGVVRLPEAYKLRDIKIRKIGEDFLVEGYVGE